MQFVKVEGTEPLVAAIKHELSSSLAQNKKVLWLVPGGSNIKVVVSVMADLPEKNLQNLTLMLTDERFGPPGHPDSNFFQLQNAGLELKGASFSDVLKDKSLEETASAYAAAAKTAFESSDKVVMFSGLGPDSHIAGILPNSPATSTEEEWVNGYDGGQFKRMTLTPFALSHVNITFVGAFGKEKKLALEKLCQEPANIREQPSRILCHIQKVVVYNDQMEKSYE